MIPYFKIEILPIRDEFVTQGHKGLMHFFLVQQCAKSNRNACNSTNVVKRKMHSMPEKSYHKVSFKVGCQVVREEKA